ncbi:MAG: hypothetical protein LCH91_15600 [Bacteroidetes bacterium]|nr:hypothetical protein [Bacteroidota bacterium]
MAKKRYKSQEKDNTPKKIQISESDFNFVCELLKRLNVDYFVLPTNEDDIDYLAFRQQIDYLKKEEEKKAVLARYGLAI